MSVIISHKDQTANALTNIGNLSEIIFHVLSLKNTLRINVYLEKPLTAK